jgi:putative addiction module component (TIGR02574 family)
MDMTAVLREVESWPVEERIQLVEAIWERIIETGAEPELTEAQRAELDRRLAALEAAPEDVVSWEAVQEYVRRPR